jgi:hypothetical protein
MASNFNEETTMSLLMPARFTTLLQRAIFIDALSCAPFALLLLVAAAPLAPLLGLPESLLRNAGWGLVAFGLLLAWQLRAPRMHRLAAWSIVEINLFWVIGSAWLMFSGRYALTDFGQFFVAAQALFVLGVGGLEIAGIRRYPFARAGGIAEGLPMT